MTRPNPVEEPSMKQGELVERRFLLLKRGLYYRPDSNGYTGHKSKAGRYLETDASPEHGVFAIHEDDAELIAPGCSAEVMREIATARIAGLEEANRVLELERDAFERALRVRIWNERKAWGEKDDAAYKKINAEIERVKANAGEQPPRGEG